MISEQKLLETENIFDKEIGDVIRTSFSTEQLPILIVHIIALFFLCLCFGFLLYKPTKKFFNLRQKALQKINENAKIFLKDAEKKSQKANLELLKAKKTGLKWISDLKNEGIVQKKQILNLAYQEESKIVLEAKEESKKIKKTLQKDIKKAILQNTLLLTEKIIREKIDLKMHQTLVDDFINNLDEK